MARTNWTRDRDRRRMQHQGAENWRDLGSIVAPLLPRRKRPPQPSKRELQRMAEKAIEEFRNGRH